MSLRSPFALSLFASFALVACQTAPVPAPPTGPVIVAVAPDGAAATPPPAANAEVGADYVLRGLARIDSDPFNVADVRVFRLGQNTPVATATTNSYGVFEIDFGKTLPPGTPLRVVASKGQRSLATIAMAGVLSVGNAVISTNAGAVISGGAGNVISGGAGNIISGGAGNVISGGAGNIVAGGAGNIVAGGAGNIVAGGAGNIVAGGAGNIISGGAGNIVAGGAGNIISGGAGNIVAGPAGSIIPAGIIAGGAGNIISGGAGNIISGGAGNYRSWQGPAFRVQQTGENPQSASDQTIQEVLLSDATTLAYVALLTRLEGATGETFDPADGGEYAHEFFLFAETVMADLRETPAAALSDAITSILDKNGLGSLPDAVADAYTQANPDIMAALRTAAAEIGEVIADLLADIDSPDAPKELPAFEFGTVTIEAEPIPDEPTPDGEPAAPEAPAAGADPGSGESGAEEEAPTLHNGELTIASPSDGSYARPGQPVSGAAQ